MVEADKVEVYLVRHSNGVRYTEYTAPPGTLKFTGNANERYIEAKTDERFKIVVKLLRGFKFMGHPKVRVEYYVERGSCWFGTLSRRRSSYEDLDDRSHREDTLSVVEQFIGGRHMQCGLTFGELKSDEKVTLGDQHIAEEADDTGRIVVKFRRGHFANRKAAEDTEVQSFDPPEHIDLEATCKEVVHKHQVYHLLKHVALGPSPVREQTSGGYRREWVRAKGPGSEPIVFTIRYRSREALLALGVIGDNETSVSATELDDTAPSQQSDDRDTTGQNFDLDSRPTMSPTPSETPGLSSRAPSKGLTPAPFSLQHRLSLFSDEDASDEELFRAALGGKFSISFNDNKEDEDQNLNDEDDSTDNNTSEGGSEGEGGSGGEFVGPGYATPPRRGAGSVGQGGGQLSEQQRKRAWSEVARHEERLDAEEAAAAAERQEREARRQSIDRAKRQFLDLE